jgi:hypothetical protein
MENQAKTISQLEKKGFEVVSSFTTAHEDFDKITYVLSRNFGGIKTATLYAQVDESGEVNGMNINEFLSNIN